jgi:hypothetical protein
MTIPTIARMVPMPADQMTTLIQIGWFWRSGVK